MKMHAYITVVAADMPGREKLMRLKGEMHRRWSRVDFRGPLLIIFKEIVRTGIVIIARCGACTTVPSIAPSIPQKTHQKTRSAQNGRNIIAQHCQ